MTMTNKIHQHTTFLLGHPLTPPVIANGPNSSVLTDQQLQLLCYSLHEQTRVEAVRSLYYFSL